MRRLSVLVAVFALVALGAGPASGRVTAQTDDTGSPAAAEQDGGTQAVPHEECRVEPRPAEEVSALLGLAEGEEGEATPAAAQTPVPAPPWVAADAETATAVEETTREWLACVNADDNLRIAALMTDGAIVRFFGGALAEGEAVEGARANLAGTPSPRAEEALVRLVAVSDVSRLEDGRVAALALINEPVLPPRGQETLLLIFAQSGDRWLIDDVLQFSVVPVAEGTPAP